MAKNVIITYRPLTQWPKGRTRTAASDRELAKFKAPGRVENGGTPMQRYVQPKPIPLSQTLEDLDRELWQIGVIDAVVQIDVENERNFRQDGGIRADARTRTPAVVLSFTRNDMPLVFATDHFTRWEDNLRALTLGLEALRKLERYHIGQSGDQYRGWNALPASTTTALSADAAAGVLERRVVGWTAAQILHEITAARTAYRAAAARAHPDAGGSTAEFQLVQEAKRVLEAHHGGQL